MNLVDELEIAKKNVRFLLDNSNSLVDFHGLSYWAKVVENLREKIKAL